ncbi:hypothetical protein [Roseivivax sp. CAU 1761]
MTMLTSNSPARPFRLRDLAGSITPRAVARYLSGLTAGYQAYLVYARLSAESDAELAQRGLTRADVPGAAMDAIRAHPAA